MIRIFVGSANKFAMVEPAMERSIRENTDHEVDITFMRPESMGIPLTGCTGFTNLRFAVPELADFAGFAIYLDVDMFLLGDIAELWALRRKGEWLSLADGSTEVSVIDCASTPVTQQIPPVSELHRYSKWALLEKIDPLFIIGMEWNSEDRITPGAKLLHFTDLKTQPWFYHHPDPEAVQQWEKYNNV